MKSLLLILIIVIAVRTDGLSQIKNDTNNNGREKIIKITYDYGGTESGYGITFSVSKDSMVLVLDTVYSQQLERYVNYGPKRGLQIRKNGINWSMQLT